MKAIPTSLAGVTILEPRIFCDERGTFFESYNLRTFAQVGIDAPFVQDNQSFSRHNVLRGLHYQIEHSQGKLVRVLSGEVFDVAVDLRRGSAYFGRAVGVNLSPESGRMLWIPPGFAHGYLVLSESAEFLYKTTDYYFPQYERTLAWNDPQLGIQWPGDAEQFILSEKDKKGLSLQLADCYE